MTPLSNSLTALADDLRTVAGAYEQAERDVVEHAMSAGRMLVEAKEACPHGTWLPFLQRAGLAERTAQRWMKLHRGRLQPDTVSLLGGVSAALTFLGYRDNAMRWFDEAERCAIHLQETGEELDDEKSIGTVRSMEMALNYIEAMVCCFPGAEQAHG